MTFWGRFPRFAGICKCQYKRWMVSFTLQSVCGNTAPNTHGTGSRWSTWQVRLLLQTDHWFNMQARNLSRYRQNGNCWSQSLLCHYIS